MRVEQGKVAVPLEVRDTLALSGVAEAGGVVYSGGELHLSGVMHGRLHVERGGVANVAGVFRGILDNEGRVTVSGVFEGEIARNSGELLGHAGSIWHHQGRRLSLGADGSLNEPPPDSSYTITNETPLCRYVDGSFEPVT